jgi:hypothetical protein
LAFLSDFSEYTHAYTDVCSSVVWGLYVNLFFKLVAFLSVVWVLNVPYLHSAGGGDSCVDESDPQSLLDSLGTLSPEELAKQCAHEGFDFNEINELVQGELAGRSLDGEQEPASFKRVPDMGSLAPSVAAAIAMPQGQAPTLDDLIAQQKVVVNQQGFIDWQIASYASPYSATIPEPQAPLVALGSGIAHFLDTKVRGKRLEVVAMVSYIMYRQLSFFYTQRVSELCAQAPLHGKVKFTQTEAILGMMGFNSRALAYTDFLLRASFCSARMWMDLSACLKAFKQYEFLRDPEGYLRTVKFYIDRARQLFTNPLYYGTNLSLMKRVVIGLAVPFAWAGLFSNISSGVPLQNPLMKQALGNAAMTLAQEGGMHAQQMFVKKTSPRLQKKLFQLSGGVIRERLLMDVACWGGEYAIERYVHGEKVQPAAFVGRKMGEYAIRHIYMHGLIYILSRAIRGGALQVCGWMGHKVGWLLSALGFFQENPVNSMNKALHKQCLSMGLLESHQGLEEVLVYPATVFPGAFARAVRAVITKQAVVEVLAKDPGFLGCVNAMHGISVYDLLQNMLVNFLVPQQMSRRVTRIKNAVTPAQWRKILRRFLNEVILELFFDRRRLLCQVVTESVLGWLSRPVLQSLYKHIVPC